MPAATIVPLEMGVEIHTTIVLLDDVVKTQEEVMEVPTQTKQKEVRKEPMQAEFGEGLRAPIVYLDVVGPDAVVIVDATFLAMLVTEE